MMMMMMMGSADETLIYFKKILIFSVNLIMMDSFMKNETKR